MLEASHRGYVLKPFIAYGLYKNRQKARIWATGHHLHDRSIAIAEFLSLGMTEKFGWLILCCMEQSCAFKGV